MADNKDKNDETKKLSHCEKFSGIFAETSWQSQVNAA